MPQFVIDKTIRLEINGSSQRIRLCAEREGLPPILVVQAGPGFPLLHEVKKFQQRLNLEKDFMVSYWDQRGCGIASRQDAKSVSLQQQLDDLRAVLHWLKNETGQTVIAFGISLGATLALQASEYERDSVRAVVAISPDAHTASSDAAVSSFLRAQSVIAKNRRLSPKLMKLGDPPYTTPAAFQLRASLLADLGGIERGKKFSALLRETLLGLIGTYGFLGMAKAMRNMNLIQRKLLPQLASLDLFTDPPRLLMPVHYIFGEQDPLIPAEIVKQLPEAITSPEKTVILISNAGHMVHFDQPEVVRSIFLSARHEK
ncbi:alpha/beta fold hydrolase [Ferrovum myxofaciens]|uniref:Putative aminoacrylate hydrolase RutD n=2 Tax=Ferrovum myxofaciens TaxID=416213 RepID=A0A149VVE4_9PROT|nr:alpha/beta hydrolase [Ferrovum myxofaciens]KXW57187.1 putative aminoacrylate hydrolase RutD [Ferrovum myxofaciens]NNM52380.1 alpha/beta hydrolase [Pseudomonadales bacterium]